MSDVRAWFEQQIGRGRAAQPSRNLFPSEASVVAAADAPPAVQQACDFYQQTCFDWGGASIHRERDMWFVHVGTDGDDGALEVFDTAGSLLDAAFIDGQKVTWEDQAAVRARFVRNEE